MNRDSFVSALQEEFPEAARSIDTSEGLLHCEMADFRRVVESAMDDGKYWQAQKYMEFIEECQSKADSALENAIAVSFVEDFALGEVTKQRKIAVRERMPKTMREVVIKISSEWA